MREILKFIYMDMCAQLPPQKSIVHQCLFTKHISVTRTLHMKQKAPCDEIVPNTNNVSLWNIRHFGLLVYTHKVTGVKSVQDSIEVGSHNRK